MKIQVVDISAITPYFNNPRDNSNAVEPVKESIQRFGFIKPLVVDTKGIIVVGHTRYYAALRLGLSKIPVIYTDISDELVKQYRIADNKLAEKSVYDENALVEELKSLEIPESMQAFFFDDINSMLNFNFQSVTASGIDYGDDGTEEPTEESAGSESEYANAYSGEQPVSDEQATQEDYNELYKIKIVDGKRTMKVYCPYCNNIETLNLDDNA